MKKTILTTLLIFCIGLLGFSQYSLVNFTGHVFDVTLGIPVPNHTVTAEVMSGGTIMTFDYSTNNNGFFGDSIPVYSEGTINVSTVDCDGELHSFTENFSLNNNYFTFDFFICVDSIPVGCNAYYSYTIPPIGGNTVLFTDLSSGNPASWSWDFGDGENSQEQNPVHEFNEPGIYPVCLTISSNDSSCFDVFCMDIIVGNSVTNCENWFWYETWNSIDFAFMGHSVPFPADLYIWDFGDGTTGEGQDVTHTYGPSTMDTVIVTLTTLSFDPATGDSCVAFSSQVVWVGNQGGNCNNWFIVNTSDLFTFDFNGEGIPSANSYFWDFGDGFTGSGQFVEHTYDETLAGLDMLVTLTTIHTIGGAADTCVATSAQTIHIGENNPDCENFFWYVPLANYGYSFFGESVPIPADVYFWDFGDGTTGTGQQIDHTFDPASGDVFLVSLTTFAYNPLGDSCIAESIQEVWINNSGNNCENWFWYENLAVPTVNFHGESFPIPADEYYWDFGDGTTGFGQNVSHTYDPTVGEEFLVTLTTVVFDPVFGDSCIATSTQPVWIGGGTGECENWFVYESTNNFDYTFFGEAFPSPAEEYYWNFGDGTSATGQIITHTFDPALGDVFNVCLTTYAFTPGGDSCIAESCQEIFIGGQSGSEIFGSVMVDNTLADFALVGLFGMDSTGGFTYEFTTTESGSYLFQNVPQGDYYLFASLTPQSVYFYDYFPTYFSDAIFWSDAELITLGEPLNPYQIHMVPVTNIGSGPGIINGNVLMENKGPGENIPIVLMDENNNPISFAQTDENGDFIFNDLAFGTYHLIVEMPGINSETAIVTLDEGTITFGIQFYVNSTNAYLNAHDKLSSIAQIGKIYPNPATDFANLDIEVTDNTILIMQIVNQKGMVLFTRSIELNAGRQLIEINTSSFNSGLYFIQLIGPDGNTVSRKFLK
ncbi:MAG: PKD domain-containing protein [Bacteroidales bacterium]